MEDTAIDELGRCPGPVRDADRRQVDSYMSTHHRRSFDVLFIKDVCFAV